MVGLNHAWSFSIRCWYLEEAMPALLTLLHLVFGGTRYESDDGSDESTSYFWREVEYFGSYGSISFILSAKFSLAVSKRRNLVGGE